MLNIKLYAEIKQVEAQVVAGAIALNEAIHCLKTIAEFSELLDEPVILPLLPGLSVIYPEDPYYGLGEYDEADEGDCKVFQ